VTITVKRTGGAASGVTVAYATSNLGATAGSDYIAKAKTLTFAAGVSSKKFTITILNNGARENREKFQLTLSSPGGGASIGLIATATVAIEDND
jgi:hypothetical protein